MHRTLTRPRLFYQAEVVLRLRECHAEEWESFRGSVPLYQPKILLPGMEKGDTKAASSIQATERI